MANTIQPPVAKAQMLIRRPAAEAFKAFVDPIVTTRFWFTHSSGRLEAGKKIRWDWEMYGVSTTVEVKVLSGASGVTGGTGGTPRPARVTERFSNNFALQRRS